MVSNLAESKFALMKNYKPVYDHVWYWKNPHHGERLGQPCRIVRRGGRNSILVEFEDGFLTITSKWAVRLAVASVRSTIRRPTPQLDLLFPGNGSPPGVGKVNP
jgi:hypothetical protein